MTDSGQRYGNRRLPSVRIGDILTVEQGHYCYGLGRLVLEVLEVGRHERHTDGVWQHLRGIEVQPDGLRLRQRRVLVRLAAIAVRPGPLARRRWITRPVGGNRSAPATARVPPLAHLATPPTWTCVSCGAEWPCPPRRNRLLQNYGSGSPALIFYLNQRLGEAAYDLRDLTPDQLRARFLGWAG